MHMGSSTVAIDNFSAHQASAFFLTHMHTDHTRGLHDWCEGPIFCSRITQTLLQHKWPALVAPVVPLSLNETTSITLPGHRPFSATSFEANHCPGSVMFLFESTFGKVLHTGDCRLGSQEQSALMQHPAVSCGPLKLLVLDNTYCHPRFTFLSKQDAAGSTVNIVLQHPTFNVLIGIDLLGKEDVLAAVARATGECIGVQSSRLTSIAAAGYDVNLFTTDLSSTRISALPRWMVCVKLLARLNRTKPTLGIKLSGSACLHSASSITQCDSRLSQPADTLHVLHQTRRLPQSFKQTPHALLSATRSTVRSSDNANPTSTSGSPAPQQPLGTSEAPSDSLPYFASFGHAKKDFHAALDRPYAVTAQEQQQALQLMKLVPYSDHSSFRELESFVTRLRPSTVLPVVKAAHNQGYLIDPNIHFKHLLGAPDNDSQIQRLTGTDGVRTASAIPLLDDRGAHRPLQVHRWQEVHGYYQSRNKRLCLSASKGTNRACKITASLPGTFVNPIVVDSLKDGWSTKEAFSSSPRLSHSELFTPEPCTPDCSGTGVKPAADTAMIRLHNCNMSPSITILCTEDATIPKQANADEVCNRSMVNKGGRSHPSERSHSNGICLHKVVCSVLAAASRRRD